ncbi:MAG: hypothetical protein H6Q14_985 [Bacteroidetes bacterium]|nr:hypothetical protein [Bacteroidota bacterium]
MKNKITFSLFLAIACYSHAQKKPLDHSVYDGWKQTGNLNISAKGNITSFEVQPQEGDGRLVFHQRNNSPDIVVERGYDAVVTPDEKIAVCLIKPFFKDTRAAKIKKVKPESMPKDSIVIISLKEGKMQKFPNVVSYQIGYKNASSVAFIRDDTTLIRKPDRKVKEIGKPLLVYYFETGKIDTLPYVDQYAFDKWGKSLVVVTRDTTKKQSVVTLDIETRKLQTVARPRAFYNFSSFNETGEKFLFLASDDTLSSGTKKCELFLYKKANESSELLVSKQNTKNFPNNWAMNENSRPFFSKSGNRIFVGIAPVQEPKDTTLVPFETTSLDVWNYADKQLPPMQLKRLKEDLKRICLAVYNPQSNELIPLTTSFFDEIQLMDEGNSSMALSIDESKTVVETQWNTQNEKELSLVNLRDGHRSFIASGKFSHVAPSPDGNFVAWYNLSDGHWYIYNLKKGAVLCLTHQLKANFGDEENDIPQFPDPYGLAGWTSADKSVLLYDRFDIWQFPTDGSVPTNLTAGEGRKSNRVFRYSNTKERPDKRVAGLSPIEEKDFISPSERLLLTVFDKTSKKQGYAMLEQSKNAVPEIKVLDGFTFSQLVKAKNADVFAYQKANFQTSPDIFLTANGWAKEEKLSNINPQMKDYNWGTSELMKWTTFDGTALEGLLYKPENFDPNKKYPVLIYFYERNSDKLYSYYAPAPSRSIINIPFFCSRGYVVFVPDIVYKTGLPGESAYNCIVSGAENLARNAWVDKQNMAIQGQSWGGYQVAYLITRTNMFKAAGAGAPVSNMTSAYGGIRWGTGMSRQFQYEHTQSRIGRTLWEAPELYVSNSPLFKADKVETPLLIMHNDADGAVPWYQGIEYFMALRRLGKKAWMLQYNNEDHNLTERRNMKDLSMRLQQFFDYYLKSGPMPAWMKSGIPASRKGQYFGLEDAK